MMQMPNAQPDFLDLNPPVEVRRCWVDESDAMRWGAQQGYEKALTDMHLACPDSALPPISIFSYWLDIFQNDPLKACFSAWQSGFEHGKQQDQQ